MSDAGPAMSVRKIYCVLSARSLPYAKLAFSSLDDRCIEPFEITIITDSADDQRLIEEEVAPLASAPAVKARRVWRVVDKAAADERAAHVYEHHPGLQTFRNGHPCWRKITDPVLFAGPGEEMIVLDPDLYFPNDFDFEPTPRTGIALMWQRPHCLLPPQCVEAAMKGGFPLAHHTDIGVAQLRNDLDLDWLQALVETLGGPAIPRMMHVESIVWAAMAMARGGHYLDPALWHCWENAHWKRLALKLQLPGERLLGIEPFASIKCFHGGGKAKWWVPRRIALLGPDVPRRVVGPGRTPSFTALTAKAYADRERLKRIAAQVGYYRIFGAQH